MSADRQALGARLRAAREADPYWSREQLARLLRAAADPRELEFGTIAHVTSLARRIKAWERGDAVPAPKYRRLYARVLETAEEELFGVLADAPAAKAAEPVAAYDRLRRGLEEALTAGAMVEASLEEWEQTVLHHGKAARYRPAPVMLADLAADLEDLQTAMRKHRGPSTLRRLTRVTAQMAGLMCLTLIKLDDRPVFRRWARTARIAARESGDPYTRSWVLAQEAYGHFYSGDMQEAISVAQAAQQVTRPCVGAVLAAALEARAAACSRESRHTRQALHRTEDLLGELPAEEVNASAFGYDEAQLRFHEGNALTHLGDTAAAWTAQQLALQLCSPDDFMDRTLTQLDRTLCLARDGDTAGALEYATAALAPLTDEQRQGIIAQRGREVLAVLTPWQRRLPAARQLRELLTPERM